MYREAEIQPTNKRQKAVNKLKTKWLFKNRKFVTRQERLIYGGNVVQEQPEKKYH